MQIRWQTLGAVPIAMPVAGLHERAWPEHVSFSLFVRRGAWRQSSRLASARPHLLQISGAGSIETDKQIGEDVHQARSFHPQPPLVPGQAQLAQGPDLCVGHEAGTEVELGVRFGGCHPRHGHVDDLVPERAERPSVGLGEQDS